ncbi:unnamed protein product [Euphydryas editha]|uniref:Uncharacterized protein n=1 Tax=Euphydryas editha TaxID=104508 RepID=A0AAU9TG32_EUPED|nr:unnamed protein product [Euphydryas editha]
MCGPISGGTPSGVAGSPVVGGTRKRGESVGTGGAVGEGVAPGGRREMGGRFFPPFGGRSGRVRSSVPYRWARKRSGWARRRTSHWAPGPADVRAQLRGFAIWGSWESSGGRDAKAR